MKLTGLERFKQIVDRYTELDVQKIKEAIDMLCAKGVANGCYQDYAILIDILEVLTAFEEAVAEQEAQS